MYDYKSVIIWSTGEKQVYEYETYTDAVNGEDSMRMAFGNQIQWSGIIRKI